MATLKCPSCGAPINVVEKKTGLWWGLGCLAAVFALPFVLAVVGVLAAIAVPNFLKARDASQHSACVANMKLLADAKAKILVETECQPGDVIPAADLALVLGRPVDSFKCPKGGHYAIKPAGQDPACSLHGSLTSALESRGRRPDPTVER